ncbi:MAG TPA: SMP-30/gluconolactonase/LRE family protein [Bauldia sp.]|nr:SMP-30/gluconolactonase/LRE family protein [Bauldia sp.]
MKPLLDISAARVFVEGIFSEPRIAHPEGVAVHADGSVWCGTETGDLIRIEADGKSHARMGATGGFLLGLAFDTAGNCFMCDLRHSAIFRWDAKTGRAEKFAAAGIKVPNYPVVDEQRGFLYVSESAGDPGVGIFRYDLKTGAGGVWCKGPTRFANGMAMAPDRQSLYFVESNEPCVSRVLFEKDGSAGRIERVASETRNVPDGLAFAGDGTLYISCYEPSRIYRLKPGGVLELLIEDPASTVISHPTNIALKGDRMYTANLGRWHITEVDLAHRARDSTRA